ncbi:MAG: hypothetical protein J7K21_05220 [Desulfurococcales archaeon]|nr:hypothetical protein [Desulfurococcales archaeon]
MLMAKKKCSIEECNEEGIHEVSYVNAKVLEEKGYKLHVYGAHPPRRPGVIYLCEKHYKLWKKLFKKESKMERFVMKG